SAVRSSVKSLKTEINERIQTIANLTGASMTLTADYPEWQFATESKIRDIMMSVYKNITGKELHIDAIHAGLECGFLAEKLGNIDMISFGPEMHDVHTPKECLIISSTERTYDFLCKILEEVK
ncbi:MAG TPA: aminoacyl-histidine dipeptidase, partial [Firmicutes bacterium]|nr:aminoacyl-histidine dipeptidase [Bacillota bacterium]